MTRPLPQARAAGLMTLALALAAPAAGQVDEAYQVVDLAPGVFAAVAPEGVPPYLFANSLVVMGEDGVLVVDSGQRPGLARQLIDHIRARTDRPVRWLVNTHWHGDHVWGNATFRDAFPGVRILATAPTRDSIAAASRRQVREQVERQGEARRQLAAMLDTADAALAARIHAADSVRAHRIAELQALEVLPPTEVVTGRTTLELGGGRRAVLLPLGPAHTPGDLAVWLPDRRILGAGDLLEEGELWLEGADVPGWLRALQALAALDPRITLAAHGAVDFDNTLLPAARQQLQDAAARP